MNKVLDLMIKNVDTYYNADDIDNDYDLIIGLGATGISLMRFCEHIKRKYAVCDTRENHANLPEIKQRFPNATIITGDIDEKLFSGAKRIYVSPGIDKRKGRLAELSQKYQGKKFYNDINLFAKFVAMRSKVIAITGSNGKSTVTKLIGDMLNKANIRALVGGNIGIPVLDLLLDNPIADVYVLELSSFQLETIQDQDQGYLLYEHIALLLNVSEDHSDRYNNFTHYRDVKFNIFKQAMYAIVDVDNISKLFENYQAGAYTLIKHSFVVSYNKPETIFDHTSQNQAHANIGMSFVQNGTLTIQQEYDNCSESTELTTSNTPTTKMKTATFLQVKDIPLVGKHNAENILFALTACSLVISLLTATRKFTTEKYKELQWLSKTKDFTDIWRISLLNDCIQAVKTFKGLPHRLELIREVDGVKYYNDSKATNVGATRSALYSLATNNTKEKNIIILLGGEGKGADFSVLQDSIQTCVKSVILYGHDAQIIASALDGITNKHFAIDLLDAVTKAKSLSIFGDIILLSPACASYDMFKNFEHRGNVFANIVNSLA